MKKLPSPYLFVLLWLPISAFGSTDVDQTGYQASEEESKWTLEDMITDNEESDESSSENQPIPTKPIIVPLNKDVIQGITKDELNAYLQKAQKAIDKNVAQHKKLKEKEGNVKKIAGLQGCVIIVFTGLAAKNFLTGRKQQKKRSQENEKEEK